MQERLTMPVSQRMVSAEEFERMPWPHGVRLELVRGRVVEMVAPGGRHGAIAVRLAAALHHHVEAEDLGVVFDAVGCKLESNPDTVRVPDLAFVRRERLDAGEPPRGFLSAPDLAVEIVSPTDSRKQLHSKARAYLERGVRMVWVVDPEDRTVTVHRPHTPAQVLHAAEQLEGWDVIPGFICGMSRIFR